MRWGRVVSVGALALGAELLAIVLALRGLFVWAGLLVAVAVGAVLLAGTWWLRQREVGHALASEEQVSPVAEAEMNAGSD